MPDRPQPADREIVVLYSQIHEKQAEALARLGARKSAANSLELAVASVKGSTAVPAWRVEELQRELRDLR